MAVVTSKGDKITTGPVKIRKEVHEWTTLHWAIAGNWRVEPEKAVGTFANGTIVFRFHALIKNPQRPYIVVNDIPKIQSLKKLFPVYYQGQPVTVEAN